MLLSLSVNLLSLLLINQTTSNNFRESLPYVLSDHVELAIVSFNKIK